MTDIRDRCLMGSCGCREACPFLESVAESRRDEYDADPLGWLADRASERAERRAW